MESHNYKLHAWLLRTTQLTMHTVLFYRICTNFRGMQISRMSQIQDFHDFIFEDHQPLENVWILCSFLCWVTWSCILLAASSTFGISNQGCVYHNPYWGLVLHGQTMHTRLIGAMHTEWIGKCSSIAWTLAWTRFKTTRFNTWSW